MGLTPFRVLIESEKLTPKAKVSWTKAIRVIVYGLHFHLTPSKNIVVNKGETCIISHMKNCNIQQDWICVAPYESCAVCHWVPFKFWDQQITIYINQILFRISFKLLLFHISVRRLFRSVKFIYKDRSVTVLSRKNVWTQCPVIMIWF